MRDAVKFLKALADTTRLRILALLLQRDLCVCELMFVLKMEQSRVSHQLRILRDAELVEDNREGQWIIYRIPKKAQADLKLLLENIIEGRLKDIPEIQKDTVMLGICLKEQIRKKRRIS
jgi:ArsR family transcriptional regulator